MRNLSALFLLSGILAVAQQQTVPLSSPPPPSPANVSAVYAGSARGTNMYYWVIARYPSGLSMAAGPASTNTGGLASISGGTPVNITWSPVAGATGYDIVRSTSTAYPVSPTCNCAAALNAGGPPAQDTGTSSAYPPAGMSQAQQANAVISLNNRDQPAPYLQVDFGAGPVPIETGSTTSPVLSVFGQTGNVNIPVTTTDIATPADPPAGKTRWYTKGGAICSLTPAGVENCLGAFSIEVTMNLLCGNNAGSAESCSHETGPVTIGTWFTLDINGNMTLTTPSPMLGPSLTLASAMGAEPGIFFTTLGNSGILGKGDDSGIQIYTAAGGDIDFGFTTPNVTELDSDQGDNVILNGHVNFTAGDGFQFSTASQEGDFYPNGISNFSEFRVSTESNQINAFRISQVDGTTKFGTTNDFHVLHSAAANVNKTISNLGCEGHLADSGTLTDYDCYWFDSQTMLNELFWSSAAPNLLQTGATIDFLTRELFATTAQSSLYKTTTACKTSASPAACAAAPAGAVAIPTGTNPTLVVDTTAVTATSQIVVEVDESNAAATTCNSTLATLASHPVVTARSAGTSFTLSYSGTIATNPVCVNYWVVN